MGMYRYRTAGALTLALLIATGASGVSAAHQSKAPTWITTKGKTVNLTLIAAYNNVQSGFNFDGGANGKMTITVPRGDKVNVSFSNKAPIPHSAEVVGFAKKPASLTTFKPAFKGASSPNPTSGSPSGKTYKFSFTAAKTGKYLLVCAVPGHVAAGMWDNFVVSGSAKSGSIHFSK
jgi:sulfocyanin